MNFQESTAPDSDHVRKMRQPNRVACPYQKPHPKPRRSQMRFLVGTGGPADGAQLTPRSSPALRRRTPSSLGLMRPVSPVPFLKIVLSCAIAKEYFTVTQLPLTVTQKDVLTRFFGSFLQCTPATSRKSSCPPPEASTRSGTSISRRNAARCEGKECGIGMTPATTETAPR